ncbi:MAG TPA: 3-deoxy-manno-octulosonate cytidylyltransferase, partial [bacterium]|nr:3-deoxy-manno-octulosonate cytidylyltransferase [bacterium]
ASTRFEGKPLADLCGKPVIRWVYESASRARLLERVVVATDDERIRECVRQFGGDVVMTGSHHRSGTDRIIEASKRVRAEIVVNIQGDEPFIQGQVIDAVVRPLVKERKVCVTTAAAQAAPGEIDDPNCVKVVVDRKGNALYFSRAAIPFVRDPQDREAARYLKHIGIYGYRRTFLSRYGRLPHSMLEETEKLEQLRILEAGYDIRVVVTQYSSVGIDTRADLERARSLAQKDRG